MQKNYRKFNKRILILETHGTNIKKNLNFKLNYVKFE
jgi:hypothetical protein